MQDQIITPTQIRTFFYITEKHKWKILTLFLSTVITVAVGSLLVSPIYQASSQVLIKPGREDVYVPPVGGSPAVVDFSREGQKVNSEIAILTSPGLLIEVVNSLGVKNLFDFPDRTFKGWFSKQTIFKETIFEAIFSETRKRKIPPIEDVYKSVKDSLEVSGFLKSNVITITFEWPDPVIAAKVVNTFVDLYLAQHVKVYTDPQTYDLLKDQAKKWEKNLSKSEEHLEAFKHRYSITSLPEQRTLLLGKLSQIETQKKGTESEIHETTEMIASLEAQLSNMDQEVQVQVRERDYKDSATLAALKAKLVDLELQGLKDEIDRVRKMIAEEEKKAQEVTVVSEKSPIRQSLEGELLKAKTKVEALKAKGENQKLQVAAYRQELRDLDRLEKRMKELEREVVINEENYKLYLTKFEEAKISESMDTQKIANVSVIEAAIPPLKPIKPKKKLNVLIGAFLGLFGGIGMAFVIEFVNPVFRTREDVDQFLGVPVLATLPKERHGESSLE